MEKGKARLLTLNGEAFFRVRRNETPFIITTEYAAVQVVGTEFNVRARDSMLEVGVVRGSVNVSAMKHKRSLVLTQGQRAICTRGGAPQLTDNVPSIEYPGWMHGKLFFDKATFADACREIEMRFDVAITIDDDRVRNEIVTGMLNAKNAESAVTALCGLTGKTFRHDERGFDIY
jgi:ferric-dicitrate binding protein FerR (iron transport regulator)